MDIELNVLMLIIKVKYLEAFIAIKMTSMFIWFMDMLCWQ